jgi:acetyl esterase
MSEDYLARFQDAWRPLDPQVAALLAMIYRQNQGGKAVHDMTVAEARQAADAIVPMTNFGSPAIPHVETRTIAGASGPIRVRLYDPGTPAPAPTVVFLHGGGWVLFNIDGYDSVARQLAKRSGLRVLSVDYGCAPEHPFPMPLEDCASALRWAAREGAALGIDPNRLAVAGDSAGANLALAACVLLRSEGFMPVRGAALIYGAYSPSLNTSSHKAYGDGSYFMSTADVAWYWDHYLSDDADRGNPLAAPLDADLDGLPPLYVAAAECDVLRCDSEQLVARLKTAGIQHEFRLWKGMVHGCLNFMGWFDALGPEIDRIGAFLRKVTAAEN